MPKIKIETKICFNGRVIEDYNYNFPIQLKEGYEVCTINKVFIKVRDINWEQRNDGKTLVKNVILNDTDDLERA